ncbi:MAG: IS607 family transposase [Ruminococcus sp.]|nr:IS607 family transposase [Ruminococcus sp.]
MKLSEYAKRNSLSYQSAWNQYKAGLIPNARQLPTGTIVVDEDKPTTYYTVIYARVSSAENKSNLESQASRLLDFCAAKGWDVAEVIKECASGLSDTRPKLSKLFRERKATRIVVEHKDRLTHFGFHYIELLYPECEIVVVNPCEDKQDLFEDFVSSCRFSSALGFLPHHY